MLPEMAGDFDAQWRGGRSSVHISGSPEGKFVYKID